VSALKFVLWEEIPSCQQWAECIRIGVRAFHLAAASNERLKGHASVYEAMPYVMQALGLRDAPIPTYDESDLVLHIPADLLQEHGSAENFVGAIGAWPKIGKTGFADCIQTCMDKKTSDGNSQRIAMVVTRPPETYVLLRNKEDRIWFRDSHRPEQRDFDDRSVLMKWVEADEAFFQPLTGCPVMMNQVGICCFREDSFEAMEWVNVRTGMGGDEEEHPDGQQIVMIENAGDPSLGN
jgi:hypothetical protein